MAWHCSSAQLVQAYRMRVAPRAPPLRKHTPSFLVGEGVTDSQGVTWSIDGLSNVKYLCHTVSLRAAST
jgi:hypothetical protein